MTTAANNCTKCNKSSLSILLLRPSPIAKAANLAPAAHKTSPVIWNWSEGCSCVYAKGEPICLADPRWAGYVHLYIKIHRQA